MYENVCFATRTCSLKVAGMWGNSGRNGHGSGCCKWCFYRASNHGVSNIWRFDSADSLTVNVGSVLANATCSRSWIGVYTIYIIFSPRIQPLSLEILKTQHAAPIEQWKTNTFFRVYRGWHPSFVGIVVNHYNLVVVVSMIFYFHPDPWRNGSNVTSICFRMGWFNHQFDKGFLLKHPSCLGYIGDEILPMLYGIIINHYKDPYEPNQDTMESLRGPRCLFRWLPRPGEGHSEEMVELHDIQGGRWRPCWWFRHPANHPTCT